MFHVSFCFILFFELFIYTLYTLSSSSEVYVVVVYLGQ